MGFLGILIGNCGYKLKQIVFENNQPVEKTSDILFWVATESCRGVLYTPISKLDMENNKTIVLSQIIASYNDRTRTLIKKTANGTATIPFGGIIQR